MRNIKGSPARVAAFRKAAEKKAGVEVEAYFWTSGAYDGVLIRSAANETKVLGVIAALAASGNVSA